MKKIILILIFLSTQVASAQWDSGSNRIYSADTTDGTALRGATYSQGKINLPTENAYANPTINFGDGNTGIYESPDNHMLFSLSGSPRWQLYGAYFWGNTTRGPLLYSISSTSTQPGYAFQGDTNTGIGSAGADQLSLIAGGVEAANITTSGGDTSVEIKKPLVVSSGEPTTKVANQVWVNGDSLLWYDGTNVRWTLGTVR